MVNEVEQNTYGTIEIKYNRPKFAHRVLANLVDVILFIISFVAIFMLARYVVSTTPNFQDTMRKYNAYCIESGLYIDDDGKLTDIITYIDNSNSLSQDNKIQITSNGIDRFLVFEDTYAPSERAVELRTNYDELRLNKMDGEDHYFIVDAGQIVRNPEFEAKAKNYLYISFYKEYLTSTCYGYYNSTGVVYDLVKVLSNYLIWVEVPIAYVSSIILVYFIPSICFFRTRQTLGKALYRIGDVDSRFLSVSFGRNVAKWSIFLLVMIAGLFSFGIAYILSFTLMVFSKNKQGFPDYMLGIQEVDISNNRIYKNYNEITANNFDTHKKANDFRLIDNP